MVLIELAHTERWLSSSILFELTLNLLIEALFQNGVTQTS